MNEQNQKPETDAQNESAKHPAKADERNDGAWNGIVDDEVQDVEKQDGSLASDGPVSQAEAGRGADLTDE